MRYSLSVQRGHTHHMKSNFLHQSIAVGVGAVLLFAVQRAHADEPKHKRHSRAEQTSTQTTNHSGTVAKTADGTGKIPTVDGLHSTSAKGGLVGGANGQETRVPTGSLIPQTYNRRGYTTDDGNNRFIIDDNDQRIRRTDNPGEILRSIPGVTVRGNR